MTDNITIFDIPFGFLFENVTKEDIQKAKDELKEAKLDWKKRLHMKHVSDPRMFSKEENDWYNKHSTTEISNQLWKAEKKLDQLQAEYSRQLGEKNVKAREESIKKMKELVSSKRDVIKGKVAAMHQNAKQRPGHSLMQEDTGLAYEFADLFLNISDHYDMLLTLESEGYSFGENKELLFSLMEQALVNSSEYFREAEEIEHVNAQLYTEAALKAKQRNALEDDEFGLPEDRSYPLIDEKHVRSAIGYFNKCEKSKQKTLARNILKAMKRFDMIDKVNVSEKNDFYKYYKARERYMKENFDLYPFPRQSPAFNEFSVGAMIPQIPLTGSTLDKTPDSNVSMYDKVEIIDELSDDPRYVGSFSAEESVLENLSSDLGLFAESVVFEAVDLKGVLENVKKKFEELLNKLRDALNKVLSSNDNTDQELEEINRRYPKILKDHPELATIDLSDHFHDTSLSVRDTARYERETNALIDRYVRTNMSDDKFNKEFDKIRKKFLTDKKQVFNFNVKNSGEPTGKILLKGVLNAVPSIIKLATAAIIIKEANSFVKNISDKFDSSIFKTGLDQAGDIGKKAAKAVQTATTVSKDLINEAKNNDKIKKTTTRVMREAKGMKKFYGDIGQKIVGKFKKESADDLYTESVNYDFYSDILDERYKELKKSIEKANITSSQRARAKITLEENYENAQKFFNNMKNDTSLLTKFKKIIDFKGGLSKSKIQNLFDDCLLLSEDERMNRDIQQANLEKIKSETTNENRKTAMQLMTLMTVNSAAKKIGDSYTNNEKNINIYTEASLPFVKKNIVFDSELRKIVDKLKEFTSTSEISSEKLISKGMNFKKTVCTLKLKPSEDGKINPKVISVIKSLGFKESEDEGIKSIYEKEIKGILITLTYDEVMDKIKITYENTIQDTYECSNNIVEEAAGYLSSPIVSSALFTTHEISKMMAVKRSVIKSHEEEMNKLNKIESYYEEQDPNFIKFSKCKAKLKLGTTREFIYNNEDVFHYKVTWANTSNSQIVWIADKYKKYKTYYEIKAMLREDEINNKVWGLINSEYKKIPKNYASKATKLTKESSDDIYTESVDDYIIEADDIDSDMKSILSALHAKGYGTKYSCSGHTGTRIKEDGLRDGVYHGKLYSTARIVFDKVYKNLDSAPEGWAKRELEDGKSSIYVSPKTYNPKNGSPDTAFENWKKEYMESLKKWIEELPSKDKEEDVKESVIEDAELYIFNDLI